MSLSFGSFIWTGMSKTGKLMGAAQCKDFDKKSVGIYWDILKLLDGHSHLPTLITLQQRWQRGMCANVCPQALSSATAQSHLCWAFQCAD